MAGTDASILVAEAASGKKLNATSKTTGEGVVLDEGVTWNDPTDPLARAAVKNAAPAAGDYGGVVRVPEGGDVAQGASTDAEAAAGNGSVVAIVKRVRTLLNGGLPAALVGGRLDVNVGAAIAAGANRIGKVTIRNSADAADIDPLAEATFTGRINTQGQKAMAASTPVVLASDQAAIPVTANAGTNLNTSALALDAHLTDGTQKAITRGGAKGATAAADLTGTAEGADHQALDVQLYHSGAAIDPRDVSDRDARLAGRVKLLDSTGAVIDPATKGQLPAALVGGRLDDNVGSWMGSTAATVGQKAMASSLPVAIASDQTALLVNGDVDHDAVNTLKQIQVAGNARAVDDPPTAVSAVGDRVREWMDRFGSPVIRRRKIRESYTAVARLAEAAARLDQTFTQVANTNKQWSTLHHAATATKEIRLQRCWVYITSDTVAGIQGVIELRELSVTTPPATGNPAIIPRPHRIGTGAAEATCLYLPGTQGSEAAVNSPLGHVPFDTGISGAVSTVNPVPILTPVVLWDANTDDDEVMNATAPVGVYGGWAVMVRTVGVPVLRITVVWRFTEEIP